MKDYSKIIRNKDRFHGVPSKALKPILILIGVLYIIGKIFDVNLIFILFCSVFLSTLIIQLYEIKSLKSEISISLLSKALGEELPTRLQIDIECLSDRKLNSLVNSIMDIKS